jgi:hypothetical protein
MSGIFDYVEWDEKSQEICDRLRTKTQDLYIDIFDSFLPSRERSLAATNLEQVFMWIGKAIRQDQIERGSDK